MSNAVSTIRTDLPVALTPGGETFLKRFENALQENPCDFRRMVIPAAAAPSGRALTLLQDRLGRMQSWLAPSDPDEIGRMVGSLMQVLAIPNAGEDATTISRKLYRSVLAPFPAWAVGQACRRFLDGTRGNKRFAPTPAELADEVRSIIEPQIAERARLLKVLDAEVVPDPDPEMAARGLQAVKDALTGKGFGADERERRSAAAPSRWSTPGTPCSPPRSSPAP